MGENPIPKNGNNFIIGRNAMDTNDSCNAIYLDLEGKVGSPRQQDCYTHEGALRQGTDETWTVELQFEDACGGRTENCARW